MNGNYSCLQQWACQLPANLGGLSLSSILGSGSASLQSMVSFPVTHFCISQKTCLELGHAEPQGKRPYKGSVLLLAGSAEPMRANQIC